jgi:heat shock protein HslJ
MKVKLLICLSAFFLCFTPTKFPKFKVKSPFRKLFIGAKTVDCSGEGKNKCMMVKNSPEKNWEFFYDQIEGFKHEQGYEYQLLIEIVDVPEGLEDGSLFKYVLKRVISKTAIESNKMASSVVTTNSAAPMSKSRATEWILTDFIYKNNGLEAKGFEATMTLDFAQKKVFGQGPCSRYFGTLRDLEKNRVRFDNIGNTKSACDFTDKEKAFFELLPLTRNYVIEGDRMYVYHGLELIMAFRRR